MSDDASTDQPAGQPDIPSLERAGDHQWRGSGLRDFFQYKDLGIARATDGKLLMQLVRANAAPEHGTGWHRFQADFHVIYMLRGWARFMVDEDEVRVEAGDTLHQTPEVGRYLFDWSPDMEYLEVAGPVDYRTVEMTSDIEVPAPGAW